MGTRVKGLIWIAGFIAGFLLVMAFFAAANAQNVPLQGGNWAAGRVPMYSISGGSQPIIMDSGPASGGAGGSAGGLGLSEFLQISRAGNGDITAPFASNGTGPLGTHNCFYDAPVTNATGYHYLCWDANAQGGGLLAYGAGGGAAQLPLQFNINGTVWNPLTGYQSVLSPIFGGTGIANAAASTITITGAYPLGLTLSGNTSLTVPVSGTLATTATFASPPAIGNTTPAAGSFAGLTTTVSFTATGLVTTSDLAAQAASTILGNVTSSAASPTALTGAQVENLLQYTQAGTGAVEQSLNTKINKSIYVGDFGASGSSAATTGSINSSSNTLILTSASDFATGQYIRVNGAGATFALNAPTGLTVTATGTPGSTHYQYQVAPLDSDGGVGAAITAVAITNGNATLSSINYNALSWSAPSGTAPDAYAVYGRSSGSMTLLAIVKFGTAWNDVGTSAHTPVDWMSAVPLGASTNDWLLSKITAGGGTTTLTLANTASNSISGVVSTHDDTYPIRAAVAYACTIVGSTVWATPGRYQIVGQITLGNGSGATQSTCEGVAIRGTVPRAGITSLSTTYAPVHISALMHAAAIAIAGPLDSWGLSDFSINFPIMSSGNVGIQNFSGNYGDVRGVSIYRAGNIGIQSTAWTTANAEFNTYTDLLLWLDPDLPNSRGIQVDGSSTNGNFGETFRGVNIVLGRTDQIGIYLGFTDTTAFYDVFFNPKGGIAVYFDYSKNNVFPSGCRFYNLETWDNTFAINGTPASGAQLWNEIYGFSMINGATPPVNFANLWIPEFGVGGNAPTITTGGGSGSSIVGTQWQGTVTGQASANTSTTITFPNGGFKDTPTVIVSGMTGPITSYSYSATTVTVNYSSTGNFVWSYKAVGF